MGFKPGPVYLLTPEELLHFPSLVSATRYFLFRPASWPTAPSRAVEEWWPHFSGLIGVTQEPEA